MSSYASVRTASVAELRLTPPVAFIPSPVIPVTSKSDAEIELLKVVPETSTVTVAPSRLPSVSDDGLVPDIEALTGFGVTVTETVGPAPSLG